jgi:nicotinamidase-related amidase
MQRVLIVLDAQERFITSSIRSLVIPTCCEFIKNWVSGGNRVVFTQNFAENEEKDCDIIEEIIEASSAPIDKLNIYTKRKLSAFTNPNLVHHFQMWKIKTIVILGFSTCGSVLKTAMDAHERYFKTYVISDLCASYKGKSSGR